ncbi:MAG: hypothetical protein P4L83_00145 [Nevskia sp.]|nr:hypothetical protein [Nevskia sp.]
MRRKVIKALRWLLVPLACYSIAAFTVTVGGFLFDRAPYWFCPRDQLVSGMCMADSFEGVLSAIQCVTAGLTAFVVVLAGSWTAPLRHPAVPWTIFGIGLIPAAFLSFLASDALPFVLAAMAGASCAFMLMKRAPHARPAAA